MTIFEVLLFGKSIASFFDFYEARDWAYQSFRSGCWEVKDVHVFNRYNHLRNSEH